MPLLKHGQIIEDSFQRLDEDETLPEGADVIIPFARLETEFDSLKAHEGQLGVIFPNNGDADALVPYLGAIHMILLDFPSFTDGRAYSLAHQIRRLEFADELRAGANVLPDQVAFMRQCGFDAFEINERHSLDLWHRAATTISLSYQRGYVPERGYAPAEILRLRKEYSQ